MQVANCRIFLNKGHDVPGFGVTPAEVIILRSLHKNNVGSDPIKSLTDIGEIERSDIKEMGRLRAKYATARYGKEGNKGLVDHLFPGANPNLPKTFDGVWPEPVEAIQAKQNDSDVTYDEPVTRLGVQPVAS